MTCYVSSGTLDSTNWTVTTAVPAYLLTPCSIHFSSVVTIICSFRYASPCLWNQFAASVIIIIIIIINRQFLTRRNMEPHHPLQGRVILHGVMVMHCCRLFLLCPMTVQCQATATTTSTRCDYGLPKLLQVSTSSSVSRIDINSPLVWRYECGVVV